MDGNTGTRWLAVALLAVGVSGAVSLRTAPPVRAAMRPLGRISPGPGAQRATAFGAASRASVGNMAPLTSTAWTQQAELTSTAQAPNDFYGTAVAVSGSTAAIGASGTPYGSQYGAVYIFTRTTSGAWSQQAELLDPGYGDGVSDAFGIAVALQGNLLAVGAPGATGGLGAVYLYARTGSAWTQQAVVTPTDATQPENFATALALSGNTLVVGANFQNEGAGAAYIYAYNGQAWTQQAELRYPGQYLLAEFGNAVALWGNTALIAAPGAPVAFVYTRSGSTWSLQAVLSAPHSPLNFFGESVALWGSTALVGVCCAYTGSPNGAVYVFTRSGTTWSLQATLSPPGGASNDLFGASVALSYHTAVVGSGGADVFVGTGATWTFQAQLTPTDRPPTALGAVLALQGNTAVVGAPNVNGSAYVFVRGGADWMSSVEAESLARSAPTSHGLTSLATSPAAR